MSFLRVSLFTMISYYLLLHLGFCKAYQNCLVALIKIITVQGTYTIIRVEGYWKSAKYVKGIN